MNSTIQKVVAQNPSVTLSKLKMEKLLFYEDQKDELEEQN